MDTAPPQSAPLTSIDFVNSVLRLRPRVAAFDCDGTLWSGDSGERFFDWEITHDFVSPETGRAMRARYAEYKAGKVSEEQMCAEMVAMHKGMRESELLRVTAEYFETSFPSRVFPEMRDLVQQLQQAGCAIWAVSSSNEWIVRAGVKQFGIPEDRILAATVEVQDDIITDRVVRIPSGPGKTEALRVVAKKPIDVAFGNSRWDLEMLEMAKHPFVVNPNPDLEAIARRRQWPIYLPDATH